MEQKPLMLTIKHIHRDWMNYMKKIAQEAGVPDSYRTILMFLSRHQGSSQKEIADFAGTTYAAVSQTIKEMELTGYLYKEVNEKDQRYLELYLTDKGLQTVDKMRDKIHEADRVITATLGVEREHELIKELEHLGDIIRREF